MQSNLDETLRIITEHAPKLRASGVQSLSVDGISMVLLSPDPTPEPVLVDDENTEPTRDLDDPTTYGRLPGSSPPGFSRPTDLPPQE